MNTNITRAVATGILIIATGIALGSVAFLMNSKIELVTQRPSPTTTTNVIVY